MTDKKQITNHDQSPVQFYPPPPPTGPYIAPPPFGPRRRDITDGSKSLDELDHPSPQNQDLKQEARQSEEGEQNPLIQEDPDSSAQTMPFQVKRSASNSGSDVPVQAQISFQSDSESPALVFSCGHILHPTAQFCPECGNPVADEVPLWLRSSATTSELTELATIYENQERYGEVESLYLQTLAMREQRWGSQHLSVAQSLNNLAVLYEYQGRNLEAEPLYGRALAICEQLLGAQDPTTLRVYENYRSFLKNLCFTHNMLDNNISLESLHPSSAKYISELADLFSDQGKYSEAELLYQRVLTIQEKQFGSRHPNIAQSLNNLAVLYEYQGRNLEAEPLYERALAICEQQFGSQHPITLKVRENYRFLLQKLRE